MSVFSLIKRNVSGWRVSWHYRRAKDVRKKGSFSQHPNQLASAYVMKILHRAFKSVAEAEAADAMHCPTNISSETHHRLVLIVVCEVKDTDPNGGELSRYCRDIPKVTLLSRSKEDTKAVFAAYCNAFKHRVTDGYEKVILHAQGDDTPLASVVQDHIDQRRQSRKAPSRSTLSASEIRLDHVTLRL
jgi:hypothetical protein